MAYKLNENIKSLRISHGMSQVAFAKKLDVTRQCISNWENDNILPSIEMLIKIADMFGVTTDFLLGRSSVATIDVSKLTEEQRGHISVLINDFIKSNGTV